MGVLLNLDASSPNVGLPANVMQSWALVTTLDRVAFACFQSWILGRETCHDMPM